MPHIVIVGDRDSGKTTFLALLYAAQVKSGVTRADDFRFHVGLESLEEISEVFQQLMSGSFPDSAAKEGISSITFHIASRKAGLGFLSRRGSRAWNPDASASLHFVLLRNLDDEMARYRTGSSLANTKLRDVLESDAMIILVDSTKLAGLGQEDSATAMTTYDAAVESLVSAVQRSRGRGSPRRFHPIFIFSKFDSVPKEALRKAQLEGAPPTVRETNRRVAYARAFLDTNLKKTMERITAREIQGVRFVTPSYFFSRVTTEAATGDQKTRVRLRRIEGGGWEPDYSVDEYLALLDSLRKIATEAGD
jgi:hypothetical protein